MGTPKILDAVPWDAPMPPGPQRVFIAISCTVFLLSLWFVLKERRRRKDLVPVFAMVGGGIAVIYESLGDLLVSVYYPKHGQLGWVDLFGRQVPLFIGILYFWYMSIPAIYFLRRLERGITRAAFWRLYLLTVFIAVAIELCGVNLGAWIYYGPQPYVMSGVPLWCPLTYSAFLVTIAIGLQLMAAHLRRAHHWLIMIGVPVCMAGGHCAAALPAAAAMFSTENPLWIWLGGSASIAVSLAIPYIAMLVYCADRVPNSHEASKDLREPVGLSQSCRPPSVSAN